MSDFSLKWKRFEKQAKEARKREENKREDDEPNVCVCCGRETDLNEDGECESCKADLKYSIEDVEGKP